MPILGGTRFRDVRLLYFFLSRPERGGVEADSIFLDGFLFFLTEILKHAERGVATSFWATQKDI